MVFCCSTDPLDSLCWLAYSGRAHGAAIEFVFNDNDDFECLFLKNGIIAKPVKYSDDYYETVSEDLDNMAFIKTSAFEKEHEFRFVLCSDFDDETKIDVPMNFKKPIKIILYVSKDDESLANNVYKCFGIPNLEVRLFEVIQ
ncbi:MAG: hypothetical protein IJ247_07175 [Bacilli bacterium]|nr:hypothetical protein [Bacilli bacterium]